MGPTLQRTVAIVLVVALVASAVFVGGQTLGPAGVVVFAIVGAVIGWVLLKPQGPDAD